MLLTRFWALLLALSAGLLAAVLPMAHSAMNRAEGRFIEDQLRRDRYELELILKQLAREQIDAISGIAAHAEVKSALQAGRNPNDAQSEREALQRRLEILNGQLADLKGDLLLAINRQGLIIGALGIETLPSGASLASYPLARRALDGYLRDDVWVLDGAVYRMAARPVVADGQFLGAVVHGKKVDADFAKRLATRLPGATVGFFVGKAILTSATAAPGGARAEDLAAPLAEILQDPNLVAGDRTQAVPLGGDSANAVYSLVTGAAAQAGVGYVIARPRTTTADPLALFQQLDFERDGGVNSLLKIGLPVLSLGFLLALGFLWIEHDRPTRRFTQQTQALAQGSLDRLNPVRFGGRYRKAAEATNRALDRIAEKGEALRRPTNLDEVLGQNPEEARGPSFFGFAERSDGSSDDVPPPPPSVPPAPEKTEDAPDFSSSATEPIEPLAAREAELPAPPAASGPEREPAASSSARQGGTGAPLAGGLGPPVPPPVVNPTARPGRVTPVSPAPGGAVENIRAKAPPPPKPPPGVVAKAPPDPPPAPGNQDAASKTAPPPAAPPPPAEADPGGAGWDGDEQNQTLVAQIPQELLDAVTSGQPKKMSEEEEHFRAVFDEFFTTKQQCGESISGLTYPKFRQTLAKNRDQILSRHDARKVRFSVYVKAGRAALKATPVK